jgi:hypothetical protein
MDFLNIGVLLLPGSAKAYLDQENEGSKSGVMIHEKRKIREHPASYGVVVQFDSLSL